MSYFKKNLFHAMAILGYLVNLPKFKKWYGTSF